jgi:3-hydroxymyristoyl/3-hydroxydecanoyl-(acyl carrier protein) dehydratase
MPEHRSSTEVSAAHPCLPGHFPGNPVVPAVLLLQQVLEALQAWRGPHWQLRRVLAAKFLQPLLPGERFEIVLLLAETRLDFRCERGTQLLAQGSMEMTQQGLSSP